MNEGSNRKKMVEYLKKNLKKGYTMESLKWALVNQGYSRTIVEIAIKEVTKELAQEAPELKEKPIIRYEVYDEKDRPIKTKIKKKPLWKKILNILKD